jgi:thiol-disulfide isomerase/thioredoxin
MKHAPHHVGMSTRRQVLRGAGLLLAGTSALAAELAPPATEVVEWPPLTLLDGSVLGSDAWVDTAAVVVFWATWCTYCARHNARIDRLHRSAAGPHLRVLGVVMDADALAAQHYMSGRGYQFPVVVGNAALRERFTARRIVPMTCLVDRRGVLRQAIPGEMAEDDVMALAGLARSPSA